MTLSNEGRGEYRLLGLPVTISSDLRFLFLPRENISSNGRRVKVLFRGHTYEIPIRTAEGVLADIIKDPVRKERVLVLRKGGKINSPFARYSLHAFWQGEEQLVGNWTLWKERMPGIAETHSMHVSNDVRRTVRSLSPEESSLLRRPLNTGNQLWKEMRQRPERLRQEYAVLRENQIREGNDNFTTVPKKYSYRRKGLAHYLIQVLLGMAQRHGVREIHSELNDNSRKVLVKYGWKATRGKKDSGWHQKKIPLRKKK